MKKLFGTDGIRAVAGRFPLDFNSVHNLGEALVQLLDQEALKPRVIIGRDTRESGAWIEEALFLGMNGLQGEVISAGVIPTSAVSYLTKKHNFSAGIVISASHNPYLDNGIKLFSSAGTKISDEWEARLEKAMFSGKKEVRPKRLTIETISSFAEDYLDFLKSQFPLRIKKRTRVVLDCSNGASSTFAPRLFRELGFDVTAINNSPDGKNINAGCGSLHPQHLAREAVEAGADIGVAYDGDADRAIWVDETGRILNGDHTLFVQAQFMKETRRLKSDTIVATTMSNMGLEKALEEKGINLVRSQVGDKYVLDKMLELGTNLGGEQSGHTIFLDDCPTGDGLLTSLKMLEAMTSHALPLSRLIEGFEEYPQVMVNVPVSRKAEFQEFPEIVNTIETVRAELLGSGRLEVRYSGTEPLVRVMVEGQDSDKIETCAHRIAQVIGRCLGR